MRLPLKKSIYQDGEDFSVDCLGSFHYKEMLNELEWYTMDFIYFRLIDVSRWSFCCSLDANKIRPLRFD